MINVETLKKHPISVFRLPSELLESLVPVEKPLEADAVNAELNHLNTIALEQLQLDKDQEEENGAPKCRTCDFTFATMDHRKHYTTDWHRYNIKRRLVLGAQPVSQLEFDNLLEDLTESLSGSESEVDSEDDSEEEDKATAADKVAVLIDKQQVKVEAEAAHQEGIFQAETASPLRKKYSALSWYTAPEKYPKTLHFGVYRHLYTPTKSTLTSIQHGDNHKKSWTFIMMGGGHFAGAVIDIDKSKVADKQVKMLAHKTFHRYTTRRKQGGAQSVNDNSKGNANSAGAQIRRYNETALQQEVRELISQWKSYIFDSEYVFVHAPSNNKKIIYGYDGAILTKDNPRVKSVPFSTRRPTLDEIRRVFLELCTLKVIEVDLTDLRDRRQKATKLSDKPVQTQVAIPQPIPKKVDAELDKLVTLTKQGKVALIQRYLESHPERKAAEPLGDSFDEHRRLPTLLHIASFYGQAGLVSALLRDMEADPTIKSENGKTPYEMAKEKLTRNAFRRCMCDMPDKWDWYRQARVPSALTREEELAQEEKEKQKKEREIARQEQIALDASKIEKERLVAETRSTPSRSQPFKVVLGSNDLNSSSMSREAKLRLEREKRLHAIEERQRKAREERERMSNAQ